MAKLENKVVLSTSIVVDVEPGEAGNSARLKEIAQRLSSAILLAFEGESFVEVTAKISYEWLNEPGANFGRCTDCGRLVSDYAKPHQINGLIDGTVVEGMLICDECRCFGHGATKHAEHD
jgi:hypothetical protein